MKRQSILLLALIMGATSVLTGCGGSDSGTSNRTINQDYNRDRLNYGRQRLNNERNDAYANWRNQTSYNNSNSRFTNGYDPRAGNGQFANVPRKESSGNNNGWNAVFAGAAVIAFTGLMSGFSGAFSKGKATSGSKSTAGTGSRTAAAGGATLPSGASANSGASSDPMQAAMAKLSSMGGSQFQRMTQGTRTTPLGGAAPQNNYDLEKPTRNLDDPATGNNDDQYGAFGALKDPTRGDNPNARDRDRYDSRDRSYAREGRSYQRDRLTGKTKFPAQAQNDTRRTRPEQRTPADDSYASLEEALGLEANHGAQKEAVPRPHKEAEASAGAVAATSETKLEKLRAYLACQKAPGTSSDDVLNEAEKIIKAPESDNHADMPGMEGEGS